MENSSDRKVAKPIIKSFEGLRGAAAFLVVIYHVKALHGIPLIKGGYLSVDLFFVLSGYVMCVSYGDRLTSFAEFSKYMYSRLARLLPLLLFAYLAYFIVANVVDPAGAVILPSSAEILATITMIFGLGLPNIHIYNFASWSISTEFYAYVVFGVLWVVVSNRCRAPISLMIALVCYVFIFYVDLVKNGCGVGAKACLDNVASSGAMIRCLAGFFTGVAVYHFKQGRGFSRMRMSGYGEAVIAVASMVLIATSTKYGVLAFAAPLAFAILIGLLSADNGIVSNLLNFAVPQMLGRLSYSMYLLHMPLLLVFEPVMGVVVNFRFFVILVLYFIVLISISYVTNVLIEMPGRRGMIAVYRAMVA
ncbi:acyltransferase family protein [Burkholderia vietnamiensis]|uniref:acyltransferase family protein n=1 Tax=Burkholderia vietnamiensis TaxID=60552 RepID=UPI0009BEDCBD|nr:acyltransferase [Burkholderia vietnamiensis]